jgi:hypothetical protein
MTEEESVLGLLFKQIEEEKTAVRETLIAGGAKDHAEYRYLCGQLYGMSVAQRTINEMADRLRRQQE